jgi:hypothetical protein
VGKSKIKVPEKSVCEESLLSVSKMVHFYGVHIRRWERKKLPHIPSVMALIPVMDALTL